MAKRIVAGSTRHIKVDRRFGLILSDDFGISAATIALSLSGEPQRRAIAICEWAAQTKNPQRALMNWAKKHNKGRYSADSPLCGAVSLSEKLGI